MITEKKYFLKNSNLLEEVHKSKLTYCCYENEEYGNYDIICDDYTLITPNILLHFFQKHPNKNHIIIRVMTDEHVIEHCKNNKINLQELKMSPFKHFLVKKEDFEKVYEDYGNNLSTIQELNRDIDDLKEEIKNHNKNIRYYQLEKDKQEPFKESVLLCKSKIKEHIEKIKQLSESFSLELMKFSLEVLRSHWNGKSIEDGYFDVSQGKLTDGLVYMIIMLVDQYAKSGNWVGYTYLEDMKGSALVHLCDVALKFEESKSNNVFSYFTQIASNKFKATLNLEKIQSKIKSQMLQDVGYNATFNEQTNELFKNILYDDEGNEIIEIEETQENNE